MDGMDNRGTVDARTGTSVGDYGLDRELVRFGLSGDELGALDRLYRDLRAAERAAGRSERERQMDRKLAREAKEVLARFNAPDYNGEGRGPTLSNLIMTCQHRPGQRSCQWCPTEEELDTEQLARCEACGKGFRARFPAGCDVAVGGRHQAPLDGSKGVRVSRSRSERSKGSKEEIGAGKVAEQVLASLTVEDVRPEAEREVVILW